MCVIFGTDTEYNVSDDHQLVSCKTEYSKKVPFFGNNANIKKVDKPENQTFA